MRKIYIILSILLTISLTARSQVKVGNTTAPASFSVLEVESNAGGVRLPQFDVTAAAAVKTYLLTATVSERDEARGLLIYNTTNNRIEMWSDVEQDWIPLRSGPPNCVNVAALTISTPNGDSFTEYGATDLVLTANATGASVNADIFYTWYHNGNPVGIGSSFIVPKEELSDKWAGNYTVEAISCLIDVMGTIISSPQTITINKEGSITAATTAVTVDYLGLTPAVFNMTLTNATITAANVFILNDPDRMYKNHSVSGGTITFDVNKSGNRNTRSLTFKIISDSGVESPVCTIKQDATQGTAVGNYFIYNVALATPSTYTEAVDVCRKLTWISPRASIISEETLDEIKGSLTNAILSDGSYWLQGKSSSEPILGTLTYPYTLTTIDTEPATSTQTVRCIAPNN